MKRTETIKAGDTIEVHGKITVAGTGMYSQGGTPGTKHWATVTLEIDEPENTKKETK